jgi:RAB protein geranylgeranyltransferase component A
MMANGNLVRVLIHTDVTKYLYFKAVDGGYVFNKGKVYLCSSSVGLIDLSSFYCDMF